MKQYSDREFWELLRTQEWIDIGSQLGLLQELKGQLEVVQDYKGEYMKGFKGDVHLSKLEKDVSSRLNNIKKKAVDVFGSHERFEQLLFNMKIRSAAITFKKVMELIRQRAIPTSIEEERLAKHFDKEVDMFFTFLMNMADSPKYPIFNERDTNRN